MPIFKKSATMMIMTGIATKMSSAISAFVRNAMTTAPMNMTGVMTAMVMSICRNRSTCWTSLVLRVMSVEAPKVSNSARE